MVNDILLDADGDLDVSEDGDLVINAPVTSASVQALKKEVKVQLESDGAVVDEVATDANWNVRIKAEYPEQ